MTVPTHTYLRNMKRCQKCGGVRTASDPTDFLSNASERDIRSIFYEIHKDLPQALSSNEKQEYAKTWGDGSDFWEVYNDLPATVSSKEDMLAYILEYNDPDDIAERLGWEPPY